MLTELEIINSVLASAGYAAIASVDSQHPAARSAKAQVALAQKKVNNNPMWYNRYPVRLTPNDDGSILLPQNTIAFYGQRGNQYIVQNGRELFNIATQSKVFTAPVCGLIHVNTPLEDMPFSAQELVRCTARITYYTGEGGATNLQVLNEERKEAFLTLNAHNINQQDISWYDGYEGSRKWSPSGGHSVIVRPE